MLDNLVFHASRSAWVGSGAGAKTSGSNPSHSPQSLWLGQKRIPVINTSSTLTAMCSSGLKPSFGSSHITHR